MKHAQESLIPNYYMYLYNVEKINLPTSIIIIIDEIKIIVSLWNTIPSSPYLSCPCFPSKFSPSLSNSRWSSLRREFLAKSIVCKTLRLVVPCIDLLFILCVIKAPNKLLQIVKILNDSKNIYLQSDVFVRG